MHVVLQRDLPPRALNVHDRGFARDDDGFSELADFQLGVDRRCERTGQLDAFVLEGVEPRQRKRDGVGPRPQIFDPVLPGAVCDRRADFLDQRRAGGFYGDAGQHGAWRVFDGSRNHRLCQGGRRKENDPRDECQRPHGYTHVPPHISKTERAGSMRARPTRAADVSLDLQVWFMTVTLYSRPIPVA